MTDGAFTLTLPSVAANVPLARHALRGYLKAQGVPDEAVADILLAATEACTNVVQHAYLDAGDEGRVIELQAALEAGRLNLLVRDRGRGFAPRVDSPGLGLGLPVIAAVSETVEIRAATDGGTEVAMVFELDPATR
jgi:serine/threonine-protein kinase RsbW